MDLRVINLSIPTVTKNALEELDVSFQVIDLEENMELKAVADSLQGELSKLIRVVGMKGAGGNSIAVLPYTSLLDYKEFTNQVEGNFTILTLDETSQLFKTSSTSCPPLAKLTGAQILVDKSVFDMPEVIMESGHPQHLMRVEAEGVKKLFDGCEVLAFASSQERIYAGRNSASGQDELDISFTPIRLRQRIDDTFDLPAMPETAQDIMKLRVDPSADATKLAQIVSRDPSLAAQVVSWASSPYYGYQGKIDSVETAIARVLGFELVMNLALGISIGKSLKVPMEGPLGVREFWKQAIYCSSLSEKLCRSIPVKQRPERGLIYLSGLLHNFGHLLLGHIFPPQFNLVNNTILANPHISVEDIEFYILGVTHEEIGAWLMQNWHMPDELIVAVHRHHQEEFWSKHAVYSNIVLVANRLLRRLHIGDSIETEIPPSTMELLSLDPEAAEAALQDIQMESETLDMMAKQLVA